MSPAQLEATADLDVHNAAGEEGGTEAVEPEGGSPPHELGEPSVEYLADKNQDPGLCHRDSSCVPESLLGLRPVLQWSVDSVPLQSSFLRKRQSLQNGHRRP